MTEQLKKNDLVKVIAAQCSYDYRFFGKYGIVIRATSRTTHVVLSNGDAYTFWTADLENQHNENKI